MGSRTSRFRRGEKMSNFSIFIKQQNEAIEKEILDLKKKTVLQIMKRLTAHGRFTGSTPVKTGRAITNWIMNEKTPSRDFDWDDKSQKAMSRAISKLGSLTAFDLVYISNNLSYIDYIMNQGHSKQTPPNSIELAIAEVVAIMENS